MSYEKELKYLRKEFKKSEDKYREAEREGYGTDADIWQDDMVNIRHQIHIHEQAAKADEYEAKAKAFDQIIEISEECDNYMDFGDEIDAVIRSYKEERESDEL